MVFADDCQDGWIEYCGGSMFVVGCTEGGAPYGYVDWTGTTSFPDDEIDPTPDNECEQPF